MSRLSTHSLGVMCSVCREALVDDKCTCGNRHGHTFQQPNAWAISRWPEHACYQCTCPPHHCSVDCRRCLALGDDETCPNEGRVWR